MAALSPLIEIRDLRKSYQMGRETVHALAGVDLDIVAGSFYAVMGPSGSGKSSLLYLLGGLDRPTGGRIVWNGQGIESMDENSLALYRRRTIGFIFQSFNLIPSLTALDNVSYPLRFDGVRRRERQERAYELLRQVGLADRVLHRPTELSGGQQQRVAVARALINNPPIILADEPTGNLDTTSGNSIMALLAKLHQEGRTVLVVTHDPRMEQYATQMVRLLDGKIVDNRNQQTIV